MRRGFTIIELAYVITVIGLLTAVTVPTYRYILLRAHAAEAHATLHTIAHAELRHFRDQGSYVACPPGSTPVPARPVPWPTQPCWEQLRIEITDQVRFRYGVELTDDSFVVTAEADLDHDGTPSMYRLHGRNLHLEIEGELE